MRELVNEYYDGSNEIVRLLQQNQKEKAIALFNTGKYQILWMNLWKWTGYFGKPN